MKLHQKEIDLSRRNAITLPFKEKNTESDKVSPFKKIINTISLLDKGNGASILELVNNLKIKDCEEIIQELINEGEVYEISPGRIQLLK